jgi:antitoxin component HigA of HigAB toxin-antitoxin module
VLSILVEKYNDEHFPVNSPDPIESIKFRMEQMGLSQSDLVPVIGSRSNNDLTSAPVNRRHDKTTQCDHY